MNYFALTFSDNNYIEKCLTLIRLISNPDSHTLPHITLRVYTLLDKRLNLIRNIKISHLNIIEPGTFNIEKKSPPYVVYIRCESEELEKIEYKPDFPLSRLHITLYEGEDIDYAEKLFSLLKEKDWHFKLTFNNPIGLIENKIGSKMKSVNYEQHIDSLLDEIIGLNFQTFSKDNTNNDYKLKSIKKILCKLYEYLHSRAEGLNEIESYYYGLEALPNLTNNIDINTVFEKGNYYINENAAPFVNIPEKHIHVTPPEYAKDMARCALDAFGDDSKKIDFGDPSVGTGALFIAMKSFISETNETNKTKYYFSSAIGVDIDKKMAEEAFLRCGKRGLIVIYGDAIGPNIQLGSCRNLMLVNPPFSRYQDIPSEYKNQACQLAEMQTNIVIRGDAGLYVYHLLIMDKWLCKGGVAVWLLPSIFLQSRYGEAVRKYLLNNVQLLRLHIYNDENPQFENALTSTTIVTFRKCTPVESAKIAISFGDSISKPSINVVVDGKVLHNTLGNWRRVIGEKNKDQEKIDHTSKIATFEDLFDIKRGIATGANSFFVLDRNKVKEHRIPDLALKPLLPKARFLNSLIINSKTDGYPDVEPQLFLIDCDLDEETIKIQYPEFYNYLQTAKNKENGGQSIVERNLVSSRHPWYKQEKREPCPFLLTYMGRNKVNSPPLYFIMNKSKAIALNTYLLLYPKEWLLNLMNENNSLYEVIFQVLKNTASRSTSQQMRVYSCGLHKLEPGELKKLIIWDLPDVIYKAFIESSN